MIPSILPTVMDPDSGRCALVSCSPYSLSSNGSSYFEYHKANHGNDLWVKDKTFEFRQMITDDRIPFLYSMRYLFTERENQSRVKKNQNKAKIVCIHWKKMENLIPLTENKVLKRFAFKLIKYSTFVFRMPTLYWKKSGHCVNE